MSNDANVRDVGRGRRKQKRRETMSQSQKSIESIRAKNKKAKGTPCNIRHQKNQMQGYANKCEGERIMKSEEKEQGNKRVITEALEGTDYEEGGSVRGEGS